MQYSGYSDGLAAGLLGLQRLFGAAGGLIGGWLGDEVARRGRSRVVVAVGGTFTLLDPHLPLVNRFNMDGERAPAQNDSLADG